MIIYLKQNKHVIVVSLALFIVSMSTMMFFLGSDGDFQKSDYKTDIIDVGKEKSPEEQEKSYRKILHNEADAFLVLNAKGTIEFQSLSSEKSLGYSLEEMNQKLFLTYISIEDVSSFSTALIKVQESKDHISMHGPYKIRNKNGEYQIQMASIIPILEKGKIKEIAITMKDIGNHLQVEEKRKMPMLLMKEIKYRMKVVRKNG